MQLPCYLTATAPPPGPPLPPATSNNPAVATRAPLENGALQVLDVLVLWWWWCLGFDISGIFSYFFGGGGGVCVLGWASGIQYFSIPSRFHIVPC